MMSFTARNTMQLHKLLVITLSFGFLGTLYADRSHINFLVKITNNTKTPFKLYCENRRRPVITPDSRAIDKRMASWDLEPTTQAEKEKNKLFEQWEKLMDTLSDKRNEANMLHKDWSDDEIDEIPDIARLISQIDQITEQLRLVIQPGQTLPYYQEGQKIENIPCRIASNADKPSNAPTNWKLPLTILKSDSRTITVTDTNSSVGCAQNELGTIIKIEATDGTYRTSLCVDNTADNGQIYLIINEDSLELKNADVTLQSLGTK
jgi:hypothetical protein